MLELDLGMFTDAFVFTISTKLPVDVEIGRSSLAGLVMFANISENPALLLATSLSSLEFKVPFIGSAGFGGGPGLGGGCVGLDGGAAGLDGGFTCLDGGCVGLDGGCDGLGGGGAGLGGGGAFATGGRISSSPSTSPGIVISVHRIVICLSCKVL